MRERPSEVDVRIHEVIEARGTEPVRVINLEAVDGARLRLIRALSAQMSQMNQMIESLAKVTLNDITMLYKIPENMDGEISLAPPTGGQDVVICFEKEAPPKAKPGEDE